jgi:hypothetical protein
MSHIKTIEAVPDFSPSSSLLKNSLINLRADLSFDEQHIFNFSQQRHLGLITKTALSEGLIFSIRNSLQRVSVNIDDGLDDIFLKNLKKFSIPYELFTTKKDNLTALRLKYIDETIEFFEVKKKPIAFEDKSDTLLQVRSSKILLSKTGSFPTKAHWILNEKSTSNFVSYIDSSDFWEDQDFLNIYEQKNGNNNS